MPLTPEQRSLHAKAAAHSLHAKVDSTAHTKPARDAFLRRFEDQVDPDRTLSPEERRRRALHARKAHMALLALKSAQARATKAAPKRVAG